MEFPEVPVEPHPGRPRALPPQPMRSADVSSRIVVEILLVVRLSVPPLASLRDLRDNLAALDDERVLLLDFLENLEGVSFCSGEW